MLYYCLLPQFPDPGVGHSHGVDVVYDASGPVPILLNVSTATWGNANFDHRVVLVGAVPGRNVIEAVVKEKEKDKK